MPKQRFGLGRGLDALIPGGVSATSTATQFGDDGQQFETSLDASAVFEVPIDAISPNPQQPRMPARADDAQLRDLAASVAEYGLLQPLLVAMDGIDQNGAPAYVLIAGERRWHAARLAGLEQVPVVIRDAAPQRMLEMALVENLQRADLNPLEAAHGYQMLTEEYHMTHEQVAERVGRSRVTITNTLRLLQLPEKVKEALISMPQVFTEGHARAVLQIVGDAERISAMGLIIAKEMSVRESEELARRYNENAIQLTPDRRGAAVHHQTYETRAIEEQFTRAIELKVRLQRNTKGKGSLTLFFANEEQLQTIYERLVGAQLAALGDGGEGGDDYDTEDAAGTANLLSAPLSAPLGADFDDEGGQ